MLSTAPTPSSATRRDSIDPARRGRLQCPNSGKTMPLYPLVQVIDCSPSSLTKGQCTPGSLR